MLSDQSSFPAQLRPLSKPAIGAFVIALIGFADASYLAIEHFMGNIPPCSIVRGCEEVLTSPYSVIFGIPISLIGAIYYLLVLVSLFAYFDTRRFIFLNIVRGLGVAGVSASAYFVYLQIFIIGSYCLYCMASAFISLLIFILAWFGFPRKRSPARLAE